jgi:hypothetical protein
VDDTISLSGGSLGAGASSGIGGNLGLHHRPWAVAGRRHAAIYPWIRIRQHPAVFGINRHYTAAFGTTQVHSALSGNNWQRAARFGREGRND